MQRLFLSFVYLAQCVAVEANGWPLRMALHCRDRPPSGHLLEGVDSGCPIPVDSLLYAPTRV